MTIAALLPIPVLLPLLAAGFCLVVSRRPRLQQLISVLALAASTTVGALLLLAAQSGPVVLDVGSWAAPIGITLIADRLSAMMLLVSQIVTLAVLVYSIGQNLADHAPGAPIAIFHPTFLVLSAGVSNAFLTGDLFNLFVGFEILLSASFVLITLGGTRGRVRAGTVYVVVSLVSSAIFLTGIALAYAATGTINIAQLVSRLGEIDPSVALTIRLVLMVAFGIKAAIFPLSAWLPDSYPTAPAPVTAVFAGLLTKVGVYAMIRLDVVVFGDGKVASLLTVLGILTMIVGILGAVAQDDLKRLLSFTLVSHIGFMLWGLAVVSQHGLASAIFYAAHHIVVQTTLFLIAGLIERRTGTTSLTRLSGLARTAPAIAVMYIVSGFNLVGIPPLTGFIGKLGLAQASVSAGTWQGWSLLAGGIITSFLTLYVVVKVWILAFWQTPDAPASWALGMAPATSLGKRRHRRAAKAMSSRQARSEVAAEASRTDQEKGGGDTNGLMNGTVWALIAVQVLMALFGGWVFHYADEAARELRDHSVYVNAVFTGERGTGDSNDNVPDTPVVTPSPNPSATDGPSPTHLPSPDASEETPGTPTASPTAPRTGG